MIIKLSNKFKVPDVWKKNIRKFDLFIFAIAVITMITTASALPEILDVFNSVYGTTNTRLDSCEVCHIPNQHQKAKCEDCYNPDSPEQYNKLNDYGMKIKESLNMDLNQAFKSIENLDSDEDRFINIDEIHNLTFPGDRKDSPKNNDLLSTLTFPTNDPTSTTGTPQLFLIKLNKMANIEWYINGSKVQNDSNAISAIYANFTASIGTYDVKAIAKDGHDSVSRIWNWTVTPQITYNVSGYVSDNSGSGLEGVLVQNGSYQNKTISAQVNGLLNGTSNITAKPLSIATLSDFNEIIRFVFDYGNYLKIR